MEEKILKNHTSVAFIFTRLLTSPFWGLFCLLTIILYKDLNASPFEIATMVALKPLASLISPYWSAHVHSKPERLISNLFWAHVIKFIPFLFFPFFSNPWFFIGSLTLFMVLNRGSIPAWMEVLKMNVRGTSQGKICSIGSNIEYLGMAILPLSFGWFLDHFHEAWRWIFPFTAVIGILSSYLIYRIPTGNVTLPKQINPAHIKKHLTIPWKDSWRILIKRPDFFKFQIGFFLGGAGLMIIQPALPKYFVDHLNLSYTSILTAIAVFKGIGFLISSPAWVKSFNKTKIFTFCSFVTLFAALFPFLLMGAKFNPALIFVAYLTYGIMQGGSELSWKMSGPIFAKEEDSAPFSSINILFVGIRGAIFPYLGSLCYALSSSAFFVMFIGAALSLSATFAMQRFGRETEVLSTE